MSKYLLQFANYRNKTIGHFKQAILDTPGIGLKDLKVSDLNFCEAKEILPGIGVYVFKQGAHVFYVGKCSSMSFIERIPKHLDFRPHAWFNRLLELLAQNGEGKKIATSIEYLEAAKFAYQNISVVLINFESKNDDVIEKSERMLRYILKPKNGFKTKMGYLEDDFVEKYML